MTKKRVVLIAIVPLLIAVTVGLLSMLPPRPGVTRANFDRIADGMNIREVESLLGGTGLLFHGFADQDPPRTFVWSGDDGSIIFVEIVDHSVKSKEWRPSTESITDKLRRWLHLP